VTADEFISGLQDASLPVSNALTGGVATLILGPGTGTNTFQGSTDSLGIADFPGAYGNAEWTISINFANSSAPECPVDVVTHNGGPGGLVEAFHCEVF
jgi:hypothetical protein